MPAFQPLKGKTILDFTRLIPGPFCTKILCDLGATVIKIEDLNKGDYINNYPPFIFKDQATLGVYLNKNKKRLKINFYSKEGQKIITQLARKADVLIESFRPGIMSKIKLGAKDLHQINQNLIYVSLTGYSNNDQQKDKAGHDLNYMAASSMLSLFCAAKTKFSSTLPAFPMADFVGGGLFAALMIASALCHPQKKKYKLNLSMIDNLIYLQQYRFFTDHEFNFDFLDGQLARYHVYQTKDKKWFALAALEDKFWNTFCDVVNLPELKKIGYNARQNKKAVLTLKKLFSSHKSDFWSKKAHQNDICLSPVFEKSDLLTKKQIKCFRLEFDQQTQKVYEAPLFDQSSRQKYNKAGSDNKKILLKTGFTSTQIKNWQKDGVISS